MYTLPNGPDPDDSLLSECGAMNLFFLVRKTDGTRSSSSSATRSSSSSSSSESRGMSSSSGSISSNGGLELVTPPLDGTILPGVTRDSILQLARG
jgi:branched-chain amino acid aminotransferase